MEGEGRGRFTRGFVFPIFKHCLLNYLPLIFVKSATLDDPDAQSSVCLWRRRPLRQQCPSQHLYYSCVSNLKASTSFPLSLACSYLTTETENLFRTPGLCAYLQKWISPCQHLLPAGNSTGLLSTQHPASHLPTWVCIERSIYYGMAKTQGFSEESSHRSARGHRWDHV